MQSPAVKTPATTNKRGGGGGAGEKSSGKKLVQARLPFKIIPTTVSAAAAETPPHTVATQESDESKKDGRKRKLSFDSENNEDAAEKSESADALRGRSASKENLTVSSKKKKMEDEADDIILLDDDDIAEEDDDNQTAVEKKQKGVKKFQSKNVTTPLSKTKLKETKASSSKLSSPQTPKHKEVVNEKKNKATPTPKSKEAKGKTVDAPKAMNSPHTPKVSKGKNEDTPKSKSASNKKSETPTSVKAKKAANTPGSAKNKSSVAKASGSATKVQIKLPLGSAKVNKRRKSKICVNAVDAEIVVSSDDSEVTAPVKRPKIDANTPKEDIHKKSVEKVIALEADKMSTTSLDDSTTNTEAEETSNVLVLEIGGNETDVPDSELESRCSSITANSKDKLSKRSSPSQKDVEATANKTEKVKSSKEDTLEKDKESQLTKEELQEHTSNDSKAKSDEEVVSSTKSKCDSNNLKEKNCEKDEVLEQSKSTETADKKDANQHKSADTSVIINSSTDSDSSSSTNRDSKSNAEQSTSRFTGGIPNNLKEDVNKSMKKPLTPKQMKLMEQRRKAREEKERRLQEEKLQKQREKEAKELERKREREEREEQRRKEREERDEQKRKEREERDEQKRKEREEKERKRLVEQEAKNEEKRKRNEAKEEDLRKKEEERKRKEEADLKAKKVAEAFQKFFKPKRTSNADGDAAAQQQANEAETLAFRPFEVKGDMKMAPICRKQLSEERRQIIDAYVKAEDDTLAEKQDLYLAELKCGKIIPGIWRRPSVDTKISEDDVQIIDDDLDRAGQAIVEETHAPIEHFRAKFYKFHENRRPPYYGTWRKRTNMVGPRRPFVQDTKFFDYEVDSDLEWEEEEPGESLDGSDDEKEKESEDDDYEVDNEWFVPHGHLSEEELQNEDEVLDANTREAQKAKLQVLQQEFAQEMKKKTEKIKPRLIGCIWTDENGNQPSLCPKIIWDTLNNRAMLCEGPPLLEDPEVPEKSDQGSPNTNGNEKTATEKVKPIKITERMLNDLVRLVHGNHHSKNFLIKEFIAYLEGSEESIKNGEVRGPLKSLVREKIDEFAEWTVTEQGTNVAQKTKKNKKRLCWVVAADVLQKMGLEGLDLHNTWKYTLKPKPGQFESKKTEVAAEAETNENESTSQTVTESVGKKNEDESVTAKPAKTPKRKHLNNQQNSKNLKTHTEITKYTKVLPAKPALQKSPKSLKSPKSAGASTQPKPETKPPQTIESKSKAESVAETVTTNEPTVKVKKRVPLLMSVARGQQISQPTKNALISEFLKKSSSDKVKETDAHNKKSSDAQTSAKPAEISEVVELD